jgi:hypothetical protein
VRESSAIVKSRQNSRLALPTLAEDLAGDIAPHALTRIPDPPPRPWRVDKVSLSGRPSEIEGHHPNFSFDGMKAGIVYRYPAARIGELAFV